MNVVAIAIIITRKDAHKYTYTYTHAHTHMDKFDLTAKELKATTLVKMKEGAKNSGEKKMRKHRERKWTLRRKRIGNNRERYLDLSLSSFRFLLI